MSAQKKENKVPRPYPFADLRAIAREMTEHVVPRAAPARPDNADVPDWVGRHGRTLLSPLRTLHTGNHRPHPLVQSANLGVVADPLELSRVLTAHLDILLVPGFLPPLTGWRSFYERCRRFIELRARIEWVLDLNPDPAPHWSDDPADFAGLHPRELDQVVDDPDEPDVWEGED